MIVARSARKTSLCTPEATGIHSVASTISLSILRERDRLGISQTELARRAGMSRSRLSELEAGRPATGRGIYLVTVMLLARELETTPDEMLGYRLPPAPAVGIFPGLR